MFKTKKVKHDNMLCVAVDEGKSIEDLYKERTPLYDNYHDIKIDCTSMTAEQVAERVLGYLS
jgi:shikimate kinase